MVVRPRPRWVLDRSAAIDMREQGLAHALVITLLRGSPGGLLGSIAARFEIEATSLSLLSLGDTRFLLILPSSVLSEQVYNGGRAFAAPTLRYHVMRWNRLLGADGASSLPCPVEVVIRGIPPHAWELATAELLLCDHCLIASVHSETSDRRDVFKVLAWTATPALIPGEMDL